MPSAFLKKIARDENIPESTLEVFWKESKVASAKTYDKDTEPEIFWGTVTKIFKRKIKKHLGVVAGNPESYNWYIDAKLLLEGYINKPDIANNFERILNLWHEKF